MRQGLPGHAEIVAGVNSALDEGAKVREGASEDVRRTRGRCRTLEGRLRSLLKGFQGEVSEQVPAPTGICTSAAARCDSGVCAEG